MNYNFVNVSGLYKLLIIIIRVHMLRVDHLIISDINKDFVSLESLRQENIWTVTFCISSLTRIYNFWFNEHETIIQLYNVLRRTTIITLKYAANNVVWSCITYSLIPPDDRGCDGCWNQLIWDAWWKFWETQYKCQKTNSSWINLLNGNRVLEKKKWLYIHERGVWK